MSDNNNNNIYNFSDFLDFNKVPTLGHEKDSRTTHTPPSDPIEDFRKSMADAGYTPPDEIITDGNIHRFQTDEDDNNEKAGWYAYFDDVDSPGGVFGDWRHDVKHTWSAHNQEEMSFEERRRHEARQKQLKVQREQKRHEMHLETAKKAEQIWQQTVQPKAHPYLHNKGINTYGSIGQDKYGNLVIPLQDENGKIWSLQFIDAGGVKKFLFNSNTTGVFFKIPGNNDKIIITEGYSTAATLHYITGTTVIAAINASNLKAVADKFRNSGSQVVVAGDNDNHLNHNTGIEKAKETGCKYVIPEALKSQENQGKGTDWNDVYLQSGNQEVLRQFNAQLQNKDTKRNLFNWHIKTKYTGPAPKRRYLAKNTIPMKAVTLLAAQGDIGKGHINLDAVLKVGGAIKGDLLNPPKILGAPIEEFGAAVYITAEDDKDEVHRRMEELGADKDQGEVYILALPDAGGPAPLVQQGRTGPEIAPFYTEIREQLLQIPNLKLVSFDPLSSFATVDVNSDPVAGTYTIELFQSLASDTLASLMLSHHISKTSKSIRGHEDARNLIRGTTALVNSCRCAYVLWGTTEDYAQNICSKLGTPYEINKVINGAVVKSNGPADRTIRTFVRNSNNGLPECRDGDIIWEKEDVKTQQKEALVMDIKDAAIEGHPYIASGSAPEAIPNRKHELSTQLQNLGDRTLWKYINELRQEGRIDKCRPKKGGTSAKWLDVPDGPFGSGEGELAPGSRNDIIDDEDEN